jgi:hypothetical protein
VSDDYNVYSLRDHTVVSPVYPNESLHSSGTGCVQDGHQGRNRSLEMVKHSSVGPVGEGLIPEFVTK